MDMPIADRIGNDGIRLQRSPDFTGGTWHDPQAGYPIFETFDRSLSKTYQKREVRLVRRGLRHRRPAAPYDFPQLLSLVHNLQVGARLWHKARHDSPVFHLQSRSMFSTVKHANCCYRLR